MTSHELLVTDAGINTCADFGVAYARDVRDDIVPRLCSWWCPSYCLFPQGKTNWQLPFIQILHEKQLEIHKIS